jgi:hypothetical protein
MVWTQGFTLARQNHSTSPFCSDYSGDRVLLFAQASWVHYPPILCFTVHQMIGVRCHTQRFSVKMNSHKLFFACTSLEPWSSCLSLPSSIGWQVCTILRAQLLVEMGSCLLPVNWCLAARTLLRLKRMLLINYSETTSIKQNYAGDTCINSVP